LFAGIVNGFNMFGIQGNETIDNAFGMNPTQRMVKDIKLPRIIADNAKASTPRYK
jgi:hypothetical protein